jgi:CheY-like chemotaxis protein/anti-sigma regulatory factor (Ser/Thr protein kinase)
MTFVDRLSGPQTARVAHTEEWFSIGRGLRFLSRSVDAQLHTDPALLETILRNLVANALKFTRRGGVALIARRIGGAVAFEVIDTGPGIARDRRERIFEEFERAREQAIGHNEGLGLGLSIVRRYAALLGLKVSMSSRIGHGTRFTLIVPRAKLSHRHGGLDNHRPMNGASKLPAGLRVLVMDDDPMIVSALTRDLADRGCSPRGATSAAEAEAILSAGPGMDAMILDFDLGGAETGLEFLSRMARRFARSTPALILTGGTDTSTLATILASQLSWLTKPAEPDMIAEALARLMEKADPRGAAIDDPAPPDAQANGIA